MPTKYFPAGALANASPAGSTSGPTLGAGGPSVIPEMTATVTVMGGNVRLQYDGSHSFLDGDQWTIALYRDGVLIAGTDRPLAFATSQGALDPTGSMTVLISISWTITMETPGSHTYDVRWTRTAGTARAVTTKRKFSVVETTAWM
jgi:hypothetical protein